MKYIFYLFVLLAVLSGCTVSNPASKSIPTAAIHQGVSTPESFITPASAMPEVLPSVSPGLAALPSPTVQGLVSDCLVGIWEVTNLPAAISSSLSQAQGSLALVAVNGSVQYAFDSNGEMQITFNQLSAELNGILEGRDVRIEQSLDGSGTARYAVDALTEQLALSEFGGQGIQSALAINGQIIAENLLPVWGAFNGGSVRNDSGTGAAGTENQAADFDPHTIAISRADAACAGDNLTLHAVSPAVGPSVTLERVD